MFNFFTRHQPPISQVWINRILVALIVGLAITAGYYFTAYQELQKEYRRLEMTKLELIDLPVEVVK